MRAVIFRATRNESTRFFRVAQNEKDWCPGAQSLLKLRSALLLRSETCKANLAFLHKS